jgi:hypothetical protein
VTEKKLYIEECFGEERALYGVDGVELVKCSFDGIEDGESALKEGKNIACNGVFFNLRYPLWHDDNVLLENCEMTEFCRAALWYSDNIDIKFSKLHGIKALRECKNIKITDSDVKSVEFGWFSHNIEIVDTSFQGEYFMLQATNLNMKHSSLKGKYSFQYIEDSIFENCNFDTKDAFWHAKNIVVRDSVVKGEYLAWYSENVTFENCTIIGTQPLCYCKGLKLINCTMIDCDLSFEKSEVEADIIGDIVSVKNVYSGYVRADSIGEIIVDDERAKGLVEVASKV